MPDLLAIGILFIILAVVQSGLKNEARTHLAIFGPSIHEKPKRHKG